MTNLTPDQIALADRIIAFFIADMRADSDADFLDTITAYPDPMMLAMIMLSDDTDEFYDAFTPDECDAMTQFDDSARIQSELAAAIELRILELDSESPER